MLPTILQETLNLRGVTSMPNEKYLFACKMGKTRSKTAAHVAWQIADEFGLDAEMFFGSVGEVTCDDEMRNHLNSYSRIFVMELWMASRVRACGYKGRLNCLNVPDIYSPFEKPLEDILRNKLEKLL